MSKWIALRCPTCGANLNVAGDLNRFTCDHCGTSYLLEQKAQEIKQAERELLSPIATYTQNLQQWLKVGNYEIYLHSITDEKVGQDRIIYANVEYRNNINETLSCRPSQWVLFDTDGYTYDTLGMTALFEDRGRAPLRGERFINPGMRVRGWLAFKVPASSVLERLQFLTGHLTTRTVEFILKH
jgi:hypothetical protein